MKTGKKPCAVVGCVCAAAPQSDVCAVHRRKPNLSPTDRDVCESCNGDAMCSRCNGTGEEDCRCSCGDHHQRRCSKCDGTGKCDTCQGSGIAAKRSA